MVLIAPLEDLPRGTLVSADYDPDDEDAPVYVSAGEQHYSRPWTGDTFVAVPTDLIETLGLVDGQRPGWAVALASRRGIFDEITRDMERLAMDPELLASIDRHGNARIEMEAAGFSIPRSWHAKLDQLLPDEEA